MYIFYWTTPKLSQTGTNRMKEGGHGELEGRRRARRSEAASGSAGQMFAGQLIYGELAERSSQDIRSHYSPDMALGMMILYKAS